MPSGRKSRTNSATKAAYAITLRSSIIFLGRVMICACRTVSTRFPATRSSSSTKKSCNGAASGLLGRRQPKARAGILTRAYPPRPNSLHRRRCRAPYMPWLSPCCPFINIPKDFPPLSLHLSSSLKAEVMQNPRAIAPVFFYFDPKIEKDA